MFKLTYDKEANAAYIYLRKDSDIAPAWVPKTYSCDPQEVNGMINLDFDEEGKLRGIEILDASKKLSAEILDSAEK